MLKRMFGRISNSKTEGMGCQEYGGRLEGSLQGGVFDAAADPGLSAHLDDCAECRDAVEMAVLASQLVREAQPPVHVSEAFVTRLMAAIRDQDMPARGAAALWRPLELLASRLALVAAVVLLGLSVYLAEFAPARALPPVATAPEIGAGLPEPPAAPANDDEILMAIAEMNDGL